MKLTIICALMVLAGTVAIADPTEIQCAVKQSFTVNVASAKSQHLYADYRGNRYYFHSADCAATFRRDPARYVNAPHTPTPPRTGKSSR